MRLRFWKPKPVFKPMLTVQKEGVIDLSMLYQEYILAVLVALDNYPDWRRGQAYFNTLHIHRPDLSEQIRGSAIDPFYVDDLIDPFLQHIRDNWIPKEEPE